MLITKFITIYNAIGALLKQDLKLPVKFTYLLNKNFRVMQPEIEIYQKTAQSYATKDILEYEKQRLETPANGLDKLAKKKPELHEKFLEAQAKISELNETEINFNLIKIPFDLFPEELPANIFSDLIDLVEE